MLTIEDCLGMSDLNEPEIEAIAEHDHLDEMQALLLGNSLMHKPGGERTIRRYLVEDIRQAQCCGDLRHAGELKQVLDHFMETHPHHPLPRY